MWWSLLHIIFYTNEITSEPSCCIFFGSCNFNSRNSPIMPNPNWEYYKWKQITTLGIETLFCKKLPEKDGEAKNTCSIFIKIVILIYRDHHLEPMWSWTSPNIAKPSPLWFQATSLLHIGQTGFGWPRSVPSRLWPWMRVQSTRELSHAGGIATSKFAGVICLSSVCSKSWGMGCSKVVGAWLLVSIQFSMYLQSHVRQRGGCHFLNPPKKEACGSLLSIMKRLFFKICQ